jgi:hypothetical protein
MKLTTPCYFRSEGMFCWSGYLHYSAEPHDPVMVGGGDDQETVKAICPACDGKAIIPTEDGKKILQFLEVFAPASLQ